MARRGADLAALFKMAISDAEAARREAEAEKIRQAEAARRARDELLDDLANFGSSVGYLAVQQYDVGVTIRFHERYVTFEKTDDDGRVKVSFEEIGEDEHWLYREAALGARWIWSWRRRHNEERMPLFDRGLMELMVMALKLPRPGDEPDLSTFPAEGVGALLEEEEGGDPNARGGRNL